MRKIVKTVFENVKTRACTDISKEIKNRVKKTEHSLMKFCSISI